MMLDAKIPSGTLKDKWTNHKFNLRLVNPANRRKYHVIVVGTGLAGGSAAASLAELGYNVKVFCLQDSPRRAHSIAAQGGINAPLTNNPDSRDDSWEKHTFDTVKGSDYLADQDAAEIMCREAAPIVYEMEHWGCPF
ncbi:MAG TPA: fumarate reductase/succinate dehydrogenase flavoprotein subunit, partial [Candidatus Omnitrophica bacterium]|nr:fumarate reductase/succinate dehydrogenase flavoprotein subunit [Candidatus Omnitrophota bacterium]